MPTKDEFRDELRSRLHQAQESGESELTVNCGAIHRAVGGYPGAHQQIASCCEVMREEIRPGDEVIADAPRGASLIVRYRLPR